MNDDLREPMACGHPKECWLVDELEGQNKLRIAHCAWCRDREEWARKEGENVEASFEREAAAVEAAREECAKDCENRYLSRGCELDAARWGAALECARGIRVLNVTGALDRALLEEARWWWKRLVTVPGFAEQAEQRIAELEERLSHGRSGSEGA